MYRMLVEIWMVKGCSDEVSDADEKHAVGQWRKNSPYYNTAKNLAELCVPVFCER